MMDILSRQKAMLEVKRSSSLTLFPNSIIVSPYPNNEDDNSTTHPLATSKVTMNIQYATTTFSILVTMDHPLDFIITTPTLLPMKYLDNKSVPPGYPDTSLVDLIGWIMRQLKDRMMQRICAEEKLSGLSLALENLVAMGTIDDKSYEIVIVGDNVILLVKFRPEKEIKYASLKELVREDQLLNSGGHFFVFKMVFKVNTGSFLPGEFAISFSSDLKTMLPELANYSQPGLDTQLASDLVEFLMHVKDSVNKTISSAVDGWEMRAKLLLQVLSIFEDGEIAIPYLDSDTMSVMDLAFRTASRKVVLKIELPTGYPKDLPKVSYSYKKIHPEGSRQTRGSEDIITKEVTWPKSYVFDNEEALVAVLMGFIAELIEKDSD